MKLMVIIIVIQYVQEKAKFINFSGK